MHHAERQRRKRGQAVRRGGCEVGSAATLGMRGRAASGTMRWPAGPGVVQGAFSWASSSDGVRVVESGTKEDAKVHDGRRAWRLLRSDPD